MQKIIVYTIFIVLSLVNKVVAQESKGTSSNRIKKIEKRKEELQSKKNQLFHNLSTIICFAMYINTFSTTSYPISSIAFW